MEGRNHEYLSPKDEHQYIIEDQNHCCLCGTKLVFKHQVDYLTLHVREEADCPTCHVRMKTRDFSLQ